MKIQEIAITSLVQDFNFYPRTMVSNVTVNDFAEAIRAGATLPPVRVCSETMRVIDGYHRIAAYKKLELEAIPATLEKVEDDADFYLRAVEANAQHGHRYTPFDQSRIIQRSVELGLPIERLTGALQVSKTKIEEIQKGWFAKNEAGGLEAVKRTIGHMTGKTLTHRQLEANRKLSGMQQSFYVNQILELINADLIDWDNRQLIEKLHTLHSALGEVLKVAA